MTTDITVRQVTSNSANIATDLATDLASAGKNKADIITLTELGVSDSCIIIVYTY